ncbi:OmpA family protein [Sulfurimonas sp.]|jgi:flagellar motor protein MotB|uniref:OmpA/MotB family protein n=1 Tax=Sulfurimonas sp. TaxID=2022749 RepID=UPI002A360068|nr:OmpA family protein [Sulfurimonas sp.]
MKLKNKTRQNCKNQDLWLTSYADLISAIFAVMVLFVSFSKLDLEKFDMVQRVMMEKTKKEFSQFSTLEQIKQRITKVAKENNLEDKISVTLDKNGLIVSFASAAQFKSGSSKLLKDKIGLMQPIFDEIIKESKYRYIDISGYTDDVPGDKVTNWELSALRALSIQKYLEEKGLNNKNIRLLANAENQPLVDYRNKQSEELAKAREANRRVSIIIREAKFSDLESMKGHK